MIFKVFVCFIFMVNALGAPESLEVWFLSNSKVSQLNELLNRKEYKTFPITTKLECQEMGDFCFDPQFGLYKRDDGEGPVDADKLENKGPSIPAAKSVDRDLISCDKNNYFDIFCGRAQASSAGSSKFDLWIDTSSSMREFDFRDKEGNCYRKSLVKRLDEDCGFNRKVNVMMFDTSIKQAGTMDSLCTNQGLNDHKRLIDWIERSNAKKLVVITDIYEFTKEFADYVESKHGKFMGDKDPLTAPQLLNLVDGLAKSCR